MQDTFVEWLVSAKTTPKGVVARVFSVFAVVVSLFSVLFIGIYSIILLFVVGYISYYVWTHTNVEYEYSFLNGELSIDQILGQTSRKTVVKIELKDVNVVAKINSEHVSGYNHSKVNVFDYSSGFSSDNVVAICYGTSGEAQKILIEPNEKLFLAMKRVNPNKVFLD